MNKIHELAVSELSQLFEDEPEKIGF